MLMNRACQQKNKISFRQLKKTLKVRGSLINQCGRVVKT